MPILVSFRLPAFSFFSFLSIGEVQSEKKMRTLTISMFVTEAVSIALQPRQSCTNKLLAGMMGDMIMPPVPMIPSHIPTGCSDFEVLIGLYNIRYIREKLDNDLS
jgi:hypothetical protein